MESGDWREKGRTAAESERKEDRMDIQRENLAETLISF